MIFLWGSKKRRDFCKTSFLGHVYSSDDLSDWFLRWAGTTDLNSGTRGGLLVVRYFGTVRRGMCSWFHLKVVPKKGVVFFSGKKISYFSVSFKCLTIFDLTGMFGPFFFSGDNLWRKLLEDTCASNIATPAPQPTLRNGIRVTVRCPSLTDSDDAECLQLLDFNSLYLEDHPI